MRLAERLDELAARCIEDDPAFRAVRRVATRFAAVVRNIEGILGWTQAGNASDLGLLVDGCGA